MGEYYTLNLLAEVAGDLEPKWLKKLITYAEEFRAQQDYEDNYVVEPTEARKVEISRRFVDDCF